MKLHRLARQPLALKGQRTGTTYSTGLFSAEASAVCEARLPRRPSTYIYVHAITYDFEEPPNSSNLPDFESLEQWLDPLPLAVHHHLICSTFAFFNCRSSDIPNSCNDAAATSVKCVVGVVRVVLLSHRGQPQRQAWTDIAS